MGTTRLPHRGSSAGTSLGPPVGFSSPHACPPRAQLHRGGTGWAGRPSPRWHRESARAGGVQGHQSLGFPASGHRQSACDLGASSLLPPHTGKGLGDCGQGKGWGSGPCILLTLVPPPSCADVPGGAPGPGGGQGWENEAQSVAGGGDMGFHCMIL